ncbi:MAG: DUF3737 family protein [Ruminococcaceae bacterium]|nr:DUF3737 family protein [Oscillospiraceae bacterium]
MKQINGKRFGEERALYGSEGLQLSDCIFSGEEDGESALKESSEIVLERCRFDLRYPLWHTRDVRLLGCEMRESCRAPIWYGEDVTLDGTDMRGIKALRECHGVRIKDCRLSSEELAWFSKDVHIEKSRIEGAYFMMRCERFSLRNVAFSGKYSFQYVQDGVIEDCELDTKDALWHAKGVTVRNTVLRGEYLAWYSEDLTLINCKIYGTQPFCYCKKLRLVDCEMHECDLAFEKSEVEATLKAPIVSIKNPLRGVITVPSVGEIIMDDPTACGKIVVG